MKISALATALLASTVVLSGCGGGGTSAPNAPIAPLVADATPQPVQAAGEARSQLAMQSVAADPTARGTRGDYGGTPAFDGTVDMYDAPLAGFSQVNVALTEVDAVSAGGAITPMQVYTTPNVVNLLALQTSSLVIAGKLPGGMYVGIRLVGSVSKSSAVASKGGKMPIAVKGADGDVFSLPVAVSFGSMDGSPASVAVDFNLAESITYAVVNGLGGDPKTLVLKPMVIANRNAGNVSGVATASHGRVVSNATIVLVDSQGKVVNTTVTANDGTFNLHAIPYGTYQVEIFNAYMNAAGSLFTATGYDGVWGSAYYGPVVTVSSANTNIGGIRD
jgi:hypothetical protein